MKKFIAVVMAAIVACSINLDPPVMVNLTIDTCPEGGELDGGIGCPVVYCTSSEAGPGCAVIVQGGVSLP